MLQNNDAVISYVNFFRWTRFPIWPNWSQQSRPDSLFGQIGPNRIPSRPARTQLGAPNPAPAATSHAGRTQFVAMRNLAPWGVRPDAIFRNLTGTGSLPKACPGFPSRSHRGLLSKSGLVYFGQRQTLPRHSQPDVSSIFSNDGIQLESYGP